MTFALRFPGEVGNFHFNVASGAFGEVSGGSAKPLQTPYKNGKSTDLGSRTGTGTLLIKTPRQLVTYGRIL
jgi:hypothetical protein